MGDRGPTATRTDGGLTRRNYSRWEIGGQPQLKEGETGDAKDYSRWEIGGQPQPPACP